jgi:hypothetical protein
MKKDIKVIDVGNMHHIRAKKVIDHIIQYGVVKDFPEPSLIEKVRYYSFEFIIAVIIAIYFNLDSIVILLKQYS